MMIFHIPYELYQKLWNQTVHLLWHLYVGSIIFNVSWCTIEGHVAGIAMGLITDGSRNAILSDILGLEDHLGDMDFKVAGTREGVTAIQLDLKIEGISFDLLIEALSQANEGRMHILIRCMKHFQSQENCLNLHLE